MIFLKTSTAIAVIAVAPKAEHSVTSAMLLADIQNVSFSPGDVNAAAAVALYSFGVKTYILYFIHVIKNQNIKR